MSQAYPVTGDQTLLQQALRWLESGQQLAMATVLTTWGSSPRPVGSQLFCTAAGDFIGSVSGGCIEGAVIQEALALLPLGGTRKLAFQVSQEQAWEVGLSCGGAIEILVQPAPPAALLKQLLEFLSAGRPAAWLTCQDDASTWIYPLPPDMPNPPLLGAALTGELDQLYARMQPGLAGERYFLQVYTPIPRLLLVGAVHIAQCLAPMARLAGFETCILDPRPAFGTQVRFPEERLFTCWPDELPPALAPDANTALVTLSHDPKIDDPALIAALAGGAFYIGALGSKKTHAQRLARLADAGWGVAAARIQGPVGLPLGGRKPAEIAVAILAQIIQHRYSVP